MCWGMFARTMWYDWQKEKEGDNSAGVRLLIPFVPLVRAWQRLTKFQTPQLTIRSFVNEDKCRNLGRMI